MITIKDYPNFGFETANYHAGYDSRWKSRNITKGLAYIPIVGSLIGVLKFVGFVAAKPVPNKVSYIARSTIEFLSLGFLLIIPDIIITIARKNDNKFNQGRPFSGEPLELNFSQV